MQSRRLTQLLPDHLEKRRCCRHAQTDLLSNPTFRSNDRIFGILDNVNGSVNVW